MTLWDVPAKKSALISGLDASLLPAVTNRLLEMGLTDGQSVRCLRRSPMRGPLVVQIGDCVYTLEQSIADKVAISSLS
ncbi:MAG: ferrous iron transport protein A [Alteromonadaceae bacterium]|uniref:Ferrous iron transport protein A n=2 Tax=Paraglaciecola mesophila TaxID=197222 RepID=K6XZK2_9ALTE|nr:MULTISPECIES: FeoA family protein [Paraglaciecola]MAD14586.1 ferrous iron transport protein A [Alteromonadaceae bacterium]MBB20102.1 ferrous iron transport protein A [Rickettsiales bacterium]GAC26034.1 ferrous iron transport protein A [Paraglaciecola mesophila KMM 241]